MEDKKKVNKKLSEEHKRNIGLARLGSKGYWAGKTRPEISGENNNLWKGDKVGYSPLHRWIRKHNPMPDKCSNCNEDKKLDLANMTGIYNRESKNWKYLCRKCHLYLDGSIKNLELGRGKWY